MRSLVRGPESVSFKCQVDMPFPAMRRTTSSVKKESATLHARRERPLF